MGQYFSRTDPNPILSPVKEDSTTNLEINLKDSTANLEVATEKELELKAEVTEKEIENKAEVTEVQITSTEKEIESQVEVSLDKETESKVVTTTEKEVEVPLEKKETESQVETTTLVCLEPISSEDLILGAATYLQTMPNEEKIKLENHLFLINCNTGFSSECKSLIPAWSEILGEEVTRLTQFIVAKRTYEHRELEARLRTLCTEYNSREFNILLNILCSSCIGGPV
jgi:hypothetical protein